MSVDPHEIADMKAAIRTMLLGSTEEARRALEVARALFNQWRARGERGSVEVDLTETVKL